MKNSKPLRILHVISALGNGGVESMLMNIYRQINLNSNEIVFDFVVHTKERKYAEEIEKMGGKIYEIENMISIGVLKYIYKLTKVIKDFGPYDVVQAHILFQNGIILLAAKRSKIKIRVSHSHLTDYQRGITKLVSPFLRMLINITANRKVACGYEAGNFLYKGVSYEIIPNAIKVDRFTSANSEKDQFYNSKYINKDTVLIGHIGRFNAQKNHKFIITLAEEMKRRELNLHIFCVGDGPWKDEIEMLIETKELCSYITLLGARDDIPNLLKTFDVFLLPSLYEGLPVVLIEAQAAGLSCVVSDTITKEADLGLSLINYISLSDSIDNWIRLIYKSSNKQSIPIEEIFKRFDERNYDIRKCSDNLLKCYRI